MKTVSETNYKKASAIVEEHIFNDTSVMTISNKIEKCIANGTKSSGLQDSDYPNLFALSHGVIKLNEVKIVKQAPIPHEIIQHFGHMRCNCMMGIFENISRLWLAVDSDIYIWSYEEDVDVIFYDGLTEVILAAAILQPKPGFFNPCIHKLLVLSTITETFFIGMTFCTTDNKSQRLHLMPTPVFSVSNDGMVLNVVSTMDNGRVFLGGKDGNLYEIVTANGWFGQKFQKVNRSANVLSYILPSIIFGDYAPIVSITIDKFRNYLYCLREDSSIELYDLGEDGQKIRKVQKISLMNIRYFNDSFGERDANINHPVISVIPVDYECSYIQMVAITQSGMRLYFTTNMGMGRPTQLTIVHIRHPPGYPARSMHPTLSGIQASIYKKGHTLMVANQGEEDILWYFSSALFSYGNRLVESFAKIPLDIPTWAIAEIYYSDKESGICSHFFGTHMRYPRNWIILSPQGYRIVSYLTPVDILKQLLIDNQGAGNIQVKTYFKMQPESEACAASLVIACLDKDSFPELAQWATQAFFIYGGTPTVVKIETGVNRSNVRPYTKSGSPKGLNLNYLCATSTSASGFQRSVLKTPLQEQPKFTVKFSAKHTGVNLYFSRVIRSIWNIPCVNTICSAVGQHMVSSQITKTDCDHLLDQLYPIKMFLNRYTTMISNNQHTSNILESITDESQIDPYKEEKIELDILIMFISHVCEILGLWKILCEHPFHLITQSVPKKQLVKLQKISFRELFVSGSKICSALIAALVNVYIEDNADIDCISNKLRDICPTLYKQQDAACAKAAEILIQVRKTMHLKQPQEVDELIETALVLCKSAGPNVPLLTICPQFAHVRGYHAIVELCIACAAAYDPSNIGLNHYSNNEPASDKEGAEFLSNRLKIYESIFITLNQLMDKSTTDISVPIPNKPGALTNDNLAVMDSESSSKYVKDIILLAVQSEDQLLHIAVYNWMFSKDMITDILSVSDASLNMFLERVFKQKPESIQVCELLWRYHEMHHRHLAGSNILYGLALNESANLNLQERISYMSRALMCLRHPAATQNGMFMKQVEDKIDIAKIQQKVIKNIELNQNEIDDASSFINLLNKKLFDITQLYEEFAEPLNLWEVKLMIIKCSDHDDEHLVEGIWKNIIASRLRAEEGDNEADQLEKVVLELKPVFKEYVNTAYCLPLSFLIKYLEILCCKKNVRCSLVASTFLEVGISFEELLNIYNCMISMNDRIWGHLNNELYIIQASIHLVFLYVETKEHIPAADKIRIKVSVQDFITTCLNATYSISADDTDETIEVLRNLQSQLYRE